MCRRCKLPAGQSHPYLHGIRACKSNRPDLWPQARSLRWSDRSEHILRSQFLVCTSLVDRAGKIVKAKRSSVPPGKCSLKASCPVKVSWNALGKLWHLVHQDSRNPLDMLNSCQDHLCSAQSDRKRASTRAKSQRCMMSE